MSLNIQGHGGPVCGPVWPCTRRTPSGRRPDNLNTIPGNPGPPPNYNPLQDTAVVRYYSVIN